MPEPNVPNIDARTLAVRAIERVVRDDAYAVAALDAEFGRAELSRRDRALATELVYGTLRIQPLLIRELEKYADRGLPNNDLFVRTALCVAAYQILALDRIPAFAAVGAAVDTIRRERGAGVGGFANALLRKLADSGARLDLSTAYFDALPEWLRGRLLKNVGEEAARSLVTPDEGGATTAVRLVAGHDVPEWLKEASPGRISPLARRVRGVGELSRQPGWDEGAFVVQEEGSQLIALAVGAQPGDRVLDACAGRGQKTSLLAESAGSVVAVDIHAHKLRALEAEMTRLGQSVQTVVGDWAAEGPGSLRSEDALPGGFDRVLVDAPCTGVGTLRHRPEITLRMVAEDAPRMGALALAILRGAALKARPGGRVTYAVCSVFKAECETVLRGASDLLEPVPFDVPQLAALASDESGDAAALRLLPSKHGTDGYFVASLRRK